MNKKQFITLSSIAAGLLVPVISFAGLVSLGGTTPQSLISAPYTSQCVEVFPHAFYEGQSFKAYDTQTPDTLGSSREILDASNVRVYNALTALGDSVTANSLGGKVPAFTYLSNGRPGTSHFNFAGVSPLLVYKQTASTYAIKPSPVPTRSTLGAQFVHNLNRRQIKSRWSTSNIYTMTYAGLNGIGGSFTANPSAYYDTRSDYECQNFYIAKCGDGVQDNPNKAGTALTDGKNGVLINGQIVPWASSAPSEACDGLDGAPAGYTCSPSCTLVALQPACTLTPASQTIVQGQNAILNYNSTNTLSIINQVNIPTTIIPNTNGFFNVQPTQTTNYAFTVLGAGKYAQTCTATVMVTPAPRPILTIHKTLINNIAYHSGDLVGWRIDFANIWSGTAHNVVLEDDLPLSLGYVSSQLYGVSPPYLFGTGMVGANIKAEYSGFNLAPGQTGYLIITGRLLSYALCNDTLNNSRISSAEIQPPLLSNALFSCYHPDANLTILKTVNKNLFVLGEYIYFTITVTNNGPDVASSVAIGDIWPNNTCIKLPSPLISSNVPTAPITTGLPVGWTYGWNLTAPLAVGQSAIINLTGQVDTTPGCAGNYLNTGTLQYVINGQTKTGQSAVPFVVVAAPLVSFTKTVLQGTANHGSTISFAIDYKNEWGSPITSYDIVDYRPGTLNFLSATPMPNTQTSIAGGLLLKWHFASTLAPGAGGRIILTGSVK